MPVTAVYSPNTEESVYCQILDASGLQRLGDLAGVARIRIEEQLPGAYKWGRSVTTELVKNT